MVRRSRLKIVETMLMVLVIQWNRIASGCVTRWLWTMDSIRIWRSMYVPRAQFFFVHANFLRHDVGCWFLAGKTGNKARNVSIPLGRLHWFPVQGHSWKYGCFFNSTNKMYSRYQNSKLMGSQRRWRLSGLRWPIWILWNLWRGQYGGGSKTESPEMWRRRELGWRSSSC